MSDMIYLNFPAVMGDGRTAANFKAKTSPAIHADMHQRIADLQRKAASLRAEIERTRQQRLKAERDRLEAERQLAASRPSMESMLAKLFAQVSGNWKGAAV